MTRRTKAEVAADKALVSRIQESLDSDAAAVERAMLVLFGSQTEIERETEITSEHNAVGFAANDATVATRIVKNVILRARKAGVPEGRRLWGSSLAICRRIAKRYAATQLLQRARAKQAAMAARLAHYVSMAEVEEDGRRACGRDPEFDEANQ